MLINLTNHPYPEWGEEQKTAAEVYGECVDIPFPQIAPEADEKEINALADEYVGRVHEVAGNHDDVTVHIMGEQTFCFSIITKLLREGIRCVASTTKRNSPAEPFRFYAFRSYV